jgi:hypothetical protein
MPEPTVTELAATLADLAVRLVEIAGKVTVLEQRVADHARLLGRILDRENGQ